MQASHKPKLVRHFERANTAVRPYAEDLERVARRWTARGGLQRNPVESIVDTDNRNDIQAQKKRRMLCIVVSRLPALIERLMLLDYQIGLNIASGMGSWNVGNIKIQSVLAPKMK